jgi:formate hydrogenlyase subunit 3/multisubunit Na+/H+ antiporter MnhD subunit
MALAIYGSCAVLALFTRGILRRAIVATGGVAGSVGAVLAGAQAMVAPAGWSMQASWLAQGDFALGLDRLGGVFLVLAGAIGAVASLYGFGYTAGHRSAQGRVPSVSYLVLVASLVVQVAAANPLTFLLAWELMSLSAYLLVLTDQDRRDTVRAATWYLGVTHVGFAALVAMFLLLSGGDLSQSFDISRHVALSAALRDAVFVLAVVGFGAKAGLVPLHIWLPMAHPVAPSHVSALLSGVVLKMGVYGFLRIVVDLLGGGPPWWGGVVLGLGIVSALLGVLYALMDTDLKRLLAYSSIENIGLIFMGIGAGLIFKSHGLPSLAMLALIAAVYHALNHAVFKSLLFMGAGSVLHATGTRNMEELGGLIKPMPVTAATMLIGSLAISAIPPLNGFVSEWLLFQSLLGGLQVPSGPTAILMPVAVGLLALTSGLAAVCFVKAFGITFLAIPRSPAAERAHESPHTMTAALVLLATGVVALGLLPFLVVPALANTLAGTGGLPDVPPAFTFGLSLVGNGVTGQISPAILALVLLALAVAVPVLMFVLRVGRQRRVSDTWGCGRVGQTPRMQYTATAFAEPLRRVFAELYRPAEDLTVDVHPESRYFIQAMAYRSDLHPWFERLVYQPSARVVQRLAARVRGLQGGSLHLYLAYIFVALLVLLFAGQWIP